MTIKSKTIPASGLMGMQAYMRKHGETLIRARPFKDEDGKDCYAILYVGGNIQ